MNTLFKTQELADLVGVSPQTITRQNDYLLEVEPDLKNKKGPKYPIEQVIKLAAAFKINGDKSKLSSRMHYVMTRHFAHIYDKMVEWIAHGGDIILDTVKVKYTDTQGKPIEYDLEIQGFIKELEEKLDIKLSVNKKGIIEADRRPKIRPIEAAPQKAASVGRVVVEIDRDIFDDVQNIVYYTDWRNEGAFITNAIIRAIQREEKKNGGRFSRRPEYGKRSQA